MPSWIPPIGTPGEIGGVPVSSVPVDRVLDVLVGERVLQFRGRRRDAVDHEGQVDRLVGVCVVGEPAGDRDAVVGVQPCEGWSQPMGSLEVREVDRDAKIDRAVSSPRTVSKCEREDGTSPQMASSKRRSSTLTLVRQECHVHRLLQL